MPVACAVSRVHVELPVRGLQGWRSVSARGFANRIPVELHKVDSSSRSSNYFLRRECVEKTGEVVRSDQENEITCTLDVGRVGSERSTSFESTSPWQLLEVQVVQPVLVDHDVHLACDEHPVPLLLDSERSWAHERSRRGQR